MIPLVSHLPSYMMSALKTTFLTLHAQFHFTPLSHILYVLVRQIFEDV